MRRELKVTVPGPDRRAVLTRVRSLVPALTLEHAPRQVTSVYFDTPNYACYQSSTAGLTRRVKLRLRWYGEGSVASNLVLELKQRAGQQGWKTRHPVHGRDLQNMSWSELRSRVLAQLPPRDALLLAPLRVPVLLATYRRHYLSTRDRRVRVTVDCGLRYLDQRNRSYPNFVFDSVATNLSIIECKLEHGTDLSAARILEPLGVRWTRFSKYCYGLEALSRSAA